jgi:hypothetical protein
MSTGQQGGNRWVEDLYHVLGIVLQNLIHFFLKLWELRVMLPV